MKQKSIGYRAALRFIMDREHFGIKLGLENIGNFLTAIDNPQYRYPSIHIAGTNGKGSTAAYLDSMLRQGGYRTGIFTSPHLCDFRERIRVDGTQISRRFITDFVERHRRRIVVSKITFFELCTALAFSFFAYKKVDIAVVEVGLGGRLDATSTLRPILTIITDISFDHTNILGRTLRKIAYEKAGIIKAGIPVLTGIMKREAAEEIGRVGRRRGAPVIRLKRSHFARNGTAFRFDFVDDGCRLDNLQSSLPGRHQILNAALSIKAAGLLDSLGFHLSPGQIRSGIAQTDWPGRFQILKMRGGPEIILDVGHNPAGVRAIAACFREMYPGRKAHMVVGFVRDKNLPEVIGWLRPLARSATAVHMNTHRTADPAEVVPLFGKRVRATTAGSVVEAMRGLMKFVSEDDIIIVCGSHFLVGDFWAKRRIIL